MCGCSFVTVAVVVMLGVSTVLITALILVSRVATFRDQSVAVQGGDYVIWSFNRLFVTVFPLIKPHQTVKFKIRYLDSRERSRKFFN
ncbi:hypothetical protein B9Z55_018821 [Caenorhabditis nigoni]|uniref:Uncharacterized protein n=1 Tax=Caenorhabditis nigoni TaxID=1611254 RepID=A0A2G5TFV7_9PELO|nr:hypothetical protein B9Z55_018821 [Caenorhabditis nigoni]